MARWREELERSLEHLAPAEDVRPGRLHRAMRHALFPGGKRLRPMLCLAAAELYGEVGGTALHAACALEFFHTYTLVHDDLPCMDDDDTRRGRPTVHRAFDPALAVLAGDALQTLSFEVLAGCAPQDPCGPGRLVAELASAGGSRGVAGGQAGDLAAAETPPDAEQLDYIHLHKTAALIRAAVRIGAMCGGARADDLEALSEYGCELGLAFQIIDDLLDTKRDGEQADYVKVHGKAEAREAAEARTAAALAALGRIRHRDTAVLHSFAEEMLKRNV
ncbi:Farnesyl diphosphate synthase [Kiritimatiella glycovorans]|uniref:Farnesyl diphosphate synthase n=2 Tax=Kiritimatiella glycovorans TaxID=1307763 RepID=A0A0G3EGD3_9BACT|nr:Farnesyl diphosphate synthase [Kiritimatiella glycovorans]